MNSIRKLHELGQSLWLDTIQRDLLQSGGLARLVTEGQIRGVTTNPSIFAAAIEGSDLYTADLRRMTQAGWEEARIFDALTIDDVRAAAGVLLPLYEETNGGDGYVSIEVNPKLAYQTQATIQEARRLWEVVNRPNVMIKIPATQAGIPAIRESIRAGINVNITLIFSIERYIEVMDAYMAGMEARLAAGDSLDHVASVASFFVSRIDSAVDRLLEDIIAQDGGSAERAKALLGKAAIASAKLAYAQFEVTFGDPRFERLHANGARLQRPLWASTSTKNPNYPDTYYVDNLIGPNTVNTVPAQTLEAFREHGTSSPTLEEDIAASRAQLEALDTLGISMAEVTDRLEREGVDKFSKAYEAALKTIRKRAKPLKKELGPLGDDVQAALQELEQTTVAKRLWEGDTSLWTRQAGAAKEASRRFGWLRLPQEIPNLQEKLAAFSQAAKKDGFKTAVLLGMGGSSLAADVMRRGFNPQTGFDFHVLDSTDPDSVRAVGRKIDLKETLFIVSSKSGGTIEPLTLLAYFWDEVAQISDTPGDHFVAVTDPGTGLESMARKRAFRQVFAAPSDVGGRFSAMSIFGLLPASLIGMDLEALHQGALEMSAACQPGSSAVHNPGLFLGAVMGAAARSGRDKLTLIADPGWEAFCDWVEQLVAESSGKDSKGILPVVGEPPESAGAYTDDRLLVYLRSEGKYDRRLRGWVRGKLPVVVLELGNDARSLGGAFFQWEVATSVSCHLIGVNAFDQPNVQRAKDSTMDLLKTFKRKGTLPQPRILWRGDGISLWGSGDDPFDAEADSLETLLRSIFVDREGLSYLAFLLYLHQGSVSMKILERVRRAILKQLGIASTVGFGPRYLHSTGQYHKGGPNTGFFLLVASDPVKDVTVESEAKSFAILERAQAIGDFQALLSLNRRAYGLHLDSPRCFKDLMNVVLNIVEDL
ncbi:MAG: bifunctional transaldolase/phosoglucose isomerase [Anaerolineales bacterium]